MVLFGCKINADFGTRLEKKQSGQLLKRTKHIYFFKLKQHNNPERERDHSLVHPRALLLHYFNYLITDTSN